jgi:hypothetical protein
VREALDHCLESGIGFGGMIGQGGYPPCMLDGELRYYEGNLGNVYTSPEHASDFVKPERCRDCSFDPYCVGVRRDYVAHHGDGEVRPFRVEPTALAAAVPLPAGAPPPARTGQMARPALVPLRRARAGGNP